MQYLYIVMFVFLSLLFFIRIPDLQAIQKAENVKTFQNIAIGKSYTLSPSPNYRYCMDTGDAIQLTDGALSDGYFWMASSTVGWNNVNPISIEIDLESIVPIGGISYSTASGRAGVRWPKNIFIFVSNDRKHYRYAGDLVTMNRNPDMPEYGTYAVRRIWTDDLQEQGRYVRLAVIPDKSGVFVDEIEVYKNERMAPGLTAGPYDIDDFYPFLVQLKLKTALTKRICQDIEGVRKKLESVERKEEYEHQLNLIEREIPSIQDVDLRTFQTRFPINDLHEKIFGIQAALWRQRGAETVTVWQKNKWDMVSPTEDPNGVSPTINIRMMRNEYRSGAFNITNLGDRVTEKILNIKGLPGGDNPPYIAVYGGVFTDTYDGIPVMAALPEAAFTTEGYKLILYPGVTRQVWLTVDSSDLMPGEYQGSIEIVGEEAKIPVVLKVYPLNFPNKLNLHLGGWDYTDTYHRYDVTVRNRMALISQLKKYNVDTPWATKRVLGQGKYDLSGNLVENPDVWDLDKWLRQWPDAKNYFVSVGATETFGGFEIGSMAFTTAVGNWITFWVGELSKRNIKPEQLGLLIKDEPQTAEQCRIIVAYATAIKKTQPNVRIFENAGFTEPWSAPQELFNLSDIQCINWHGLWLGANKRFVDFYLANQSEGKELWFYSCKNPGRLMDPYTYYLLPSWSAWTQGVKGICFWAFGDSNGASSWNEYLAISSGAYTPFFIDDTSVTTSKQVEAIREGREDYEYLSILQARIHLLESQKIKNVKIDEAKEMLSEVLNSMTNGLDANCLRWDCAKKRDFADVSRIKILDALMLLETL